MPLSFSDPDVNGMTVQDRLELIERLWDSIPDGEIASAMPEWHHEELDRRLAAADANPEQGIPWEQVQTRLRSRP